MVKQLVLRSPSNRAIVAPAYYGSARHGQPMGVGQKPIDWRSREPMIHFKRHRQWVLEDAQLCHLLKSATDISSPTIAPDSLSLSTANAIVIDGQPLQDGDLVEVRSAIAAALKISPGTWTGQGDRTLVLTNPPVYQLTSAWNIGTPWSYRVLGNGNLQGLGALTRTNVTFEQKNSGAKVTNPSNLGGGLWANVGQLVSTWQGVKVFFDDLSVRKIAMRVTSQKQPYDSRFPVAEMGVNISGQGDASWFYNYETGIRQGGGIQVWSSGQEQYWCTQAWDPAKTINWLATQDEGSSRSIVGMEMYGDVPCRIKIGNDFPTPGSTVILPPNIADDCFPKLTPGNYTVINNDGLTPWVLSPS